MTCRVRSDGECEIEGTLGSARVGPLALPVLSAFLTPRTFADVVAELETQLAGTQAALDLLGTIMTLRKVGALVSADAEPGFQSDARGEGFGSLPIHSAMLSDRVRTRAWLAGISELVRSADVVLEIGCGTGVLSVGAARAGARRVYAIEATSVAELAERVVADNGLSDVVSVLRGWSTALSLEERADVLVSEILDDDPFREGVLEATADATRRLLRPGARIMPRRITLLGVLAELGTEQRTRYGAPVDVLRQWEHDYDISFAALESAMRAGTIANVPRRSAAAWRRLSAPTVLADVKLDGAHPTRLDEMCTCVAEHAGECHGFVTYFRAELTDSISVTTNPWSREGATHWLNPVLLLPSAQAVAPGSALKFRYRYPGFPSLEMA